MLLSSQASTGAGLVTFLTSGLKNNGHHCQTANGSVKVPLFSPSTFNTGSSVSHWDNGYFVNTTDADRIMFPFAPRGEPHRHIGDATAGLMYDIGWGLGTYSLEYADDGFEVWPVPAHNTVFIKMESEVSRVKKISIVNSNGMKIEMLELNKDNRIEVPIDALTPGVYYVFVKLSNGHTISKKFVKL